MDADERFTLAVRTFADAVGAAHRATDRQAVERDRRGARARSGRPRRQRGRVARHLQRRLHRVADRRNRRDHDGGIVRPADLRSRSQFPRLSRLRGLPRRRTGSGAARRGAGGPDGAGAAARSAGTRTRGAPAAHRRAGREERRAVPRRRAGEAPDADPDRALGLPRARRDPRQGRNARSRDRRDRAEAGAGARRACRRHCRAPSRIAAKRPHRRARTPTSSSCSNGCRWAS